MASNKNFNDYANGNILFIEPIFLPYHAVASGTLNTPGISFLRGYLHDKGIPSSSINLCRLFYSSNEYDGIIYKLSEQLKIPNNYDDIDYLKKSLRINGKTEESILLMRKISSILNLESSVLWDTIGQINCFDGFLQEHLEELKSEFIGISVTLYSQIFFTLILVLYLKKRFPNCKIILGGSCVTGEYQDFLTLFKTKPIVKYFVTGAGEEPLFQLIKGATRINKIPNLTYKSKNSYRFTNKFFWAEKIDSIPSPIYETEDTIYLRVTNNCYWGKCIFCRYESVSHVPYGTRCTQRVISDLEKINTTTKNNNKDVIFTDNSLPPKFLKDFSEQLIKKPHIKNKFTAFIRGEKNFDEKILSLAAMAGFRRLVIGVETMVPRLIKIINKGTNLEDILNIIIICRKLNIIVILNFMVGLPTQSKNELLADLKAITALQNYFGKCIKINIMNTIVHPETYLFEHVKKYKIKLYKDKVRRFTSVIPYDQFGKNTLSSKQTFSICIEYFKKCHVSLPSVKLLLEGIEIDVGKLNGKRFE